MILSLFLKYSHGIFRTVDNVHLTPEVHPDKGVHCEPRWECADCFWISRHQGGTTSQTCRHSCGWQVMHLILGRPSPILLLRGNVLVSDSKNCRLQVFSAAGDFVKVAASLPSKPFGLIRWLFLPACDELSSFQIAAQARLWWSRPVCGCHLRPLQNYWEDSLPC